MAVNKVVFGNDTLIDLTEDTVQPEDVAMGETFHDRSGALRTGTSSGTGGVPTELLEDTVGWTGKNLIPNHGDATASGITWTVNADGSITAKGSTGNNYSLYGLDVPSDLTGNFYFSGCPENGSSNTYDVYAWDVTTGARCKKWDGTTECESDYGQGNKEVQFVDGHSSILMLRINRNQSNVNKTFYPMVRRTSVSDDTYEPYHESVEDTITDVYGVMGENGAKNVLDLPLITHAGVTTTKNANGTYQCVGASIQDTSFRILDPSVGYMPPVGKYKVSNVSTDGHAIRISTVIGGSWSILADIASGTESEIEITQAMQSGALGITMRDYTVGDSINTTISPMIRDARDTDPTYQPYAMTNKELTDDAKLNNLYLTSSDSSINTIKKVIIEIFTQAIPLLTKDWTKCSGLINVSGMAAMCFTVFRTSSTAFRCMVFLDQYIYVGKSISGTVTVWKFTGTEES